MKLPSPVSVLAVDDHPLVLEGLRRYLSISPAFRVQGAVLDGKQALETIQASPPGILLLDLNIPHINGLKLLEHVTKRAIPTRVVMFAGVLADREIYRAVANGAWGILLKDAGSADLLECLNEVAAGRKWLPVTVREALQREEQRQHRCEQLRTTLSPRERQILALAGQGSSNADIGSQLGISIATVKVHFFNIYQKVEATSRVQVVELAQAHLEALA